MSQPHPYSWSPKIIKLIIYFLYNSSGNLHFKFISNSKCEIFSQSLSLIIRFQSKRSQSLISSVTNCKLITESNNGSVLIYSRKLDWNFFFLVFLVGNYGLFVIISFEEGLSYFYPQKLFYFQTICFIFFNISYSFRIYFYNASSLIRFGSSDYFLVQLTHPNIEIYINLIILFLFFYILIVKCF